MRIFLIVAWAAAVLLPQTSLAYGSRRGNVQGPSKECVFTLSATSGHFPHPAGQVADGTLYLNGHQSPAVFTIDGQNSITDSHGFGCFAADGCGLQCQSGKPPVQGFTIDDSFTLLYKNSSQFYACPADSTEYGIFVQPQGDRSKCIAITLETNSSCAGAGLEPYQTSSSRASAWTVWQTSTITGLTTQTVTIVTTVCDPPTTTFFKSTHTQGARGLQARDLSPRALALRDVCAAASDKRGLLKRAPGDLNKCWEYVQETEPTNFVAQNDIRTFPLDMNTDAMFATAEYYGCTVIVFVGKGSITVAHMAEGSGTICPLSNADLTEQYINGRLLNQVTYPMTDDCDDLYVIITGSMQDNQPNNGVETLKEFIMSTYGVRPGNLRYIYYTPGASTSEFGGPQVLDPVKGRSYFKWSAFGISGTMAIYLGNETPRLTAQFNSDWTAAAGGPTFGRSPYTTDGNGNQP